jgi:L-proline amide hydrolase
MLAGQYAIEKEPAGLQKLIIADSPSSMRLWVETANRLRKALPKDIQETLTRCEAEGQTDSEEYEHAVEHFYGLHLCRISPFPKELIDSFAYLKEDSTVYGSMNGPSEFHVIGSLKDWSITDELKNITEKTCPGGLLLMNGHYDEAQDENTCAYFYNPTCKTKWVRYALSSHTPQLEETERFLQDLGRFLTQH